MVTDQFINCLYDEEMELNRDHKEEKKKVGKILQKNVERSGFTFGGQLFHISIDIPKL